MADDETNKEVAIDLSSIGSLGCFSQSWVGRFKKTNKFLFSVAFNASNSAAQVVFQRVSLSDAVLDSLELNFKVTAGLKLDAKITASLGAGEGVWKAEGKAAKSLSGQEMTVFILGPEMYFGVDLPHVLQHECAKGEIPLRTRRLRRPLTIED